MIELITVPLAIIALTAAPSATSPIQTDHTTEADKVWVYAEKAKSAAELGLHYRNQNKKLYLRNLNRNKNIKPYSRDKWGNHFIHKDTSWSGDAPDMIKSLDAFEFDSESDF